MVFVKNLVGRGHSFINFFKRGLIKKSKKPLYRRLFYDDTLYYFNKTLTIYYLICLTLASQTFSIFVLKLLTYLYLKKLFSNQILSTNNSFFFRSLFYKKIRILTIERELMHLMVASEITKV